MSASLPVFPPRRHVLVLGSDDTDAHALQTAWARLGWHTRAVSSVAALEREVTRHAPELIVASLAVDGWVPQVSDWLADHDYAIPLVLVQSTGASGRALDNQVGHSEP